MIASNIRVKGQPPRPGIPEPRRKWTEEDEQDIAVRGWRGRRSSAACGCVAGAGAGHHLRTGYANPRRIESDPEKPGDAPHCTAGGRAGADTPGRRQGELRVRAWQLH